jgi:hypothetical protein
MTTKVFRFSREERAQALARQASRAGAGRVVTELPEAQAKPAKSASRSRAKKAAAS